MYYAILLAGFYLGGHKDEGQVGKVPSEQFFRCTSSCCKDKPLELADEEDEGGCIFRCGSAFERHAGKSSA